jgi:hypothetical protein
MSVGTLPFGFAVMLKVISNIHPPPLIIDNQQKVDWMLKVEFNGEENRQPSV